MAEPDTAVRAASWQNLAEVAELLRQAEQQLNDGPGIATGGALGV